MMKTKHIYSTGSNLFAALLLTGAMIACESDFEVVESPTPGPGISLSVLPHVFGLDKAVTRTTDVPGDDALNENELGNKIDVFVFKKSAQGGTVDDSDQIWMQWHYTKENSASIEDGVRELLQHNWQAADVNNHKLEIGVYYDVYVAVNNPNTQVNTLSTLGDLKALRHSYIVGGDGNLKYDDPHVFRHWSENRESDGQPYPDVNNKIGIYGETSEKVFMMDGKITDWTPDTSGVSSQTFDVDMKRALAKIQLEIHFTDDFFMEVEQRGLQIGQIRWKYGNFAFGAKDFQDGNDLGIETGDGMAALTEIEIQSYLQSSHDSDSPNETAEGWLMMKDEMDVGWIQTGSQPLRYTSTDPITYTKYEKDNDGNLINGTEVTEIVTNLTQAPLTAQVVTYSYPFHWGRDIAQHAPYILLDVPMTPNGQPTKHYYYRVPVTDSNVLQEMQRNHLYRVKANIASFGAESLLKDKTEVDIEWEEMPWVTTPVETTILAERMFYFMVNPLEYNVYGGDIQTAIIDYFAPQGLEPEIVTSTIKMSYEGSDGLVTVTGGDANLLVPGNSFGYTRVDDKYWQNAEGTKIYQAIASQGQLHAGGAHRIEVLSNEEGNGSRIRVYSEMLQNHAVKTISFTLRLTYTDLEGVVNTIERNVVIHHHPVDEINHIKGAWSSRAVEIYEYSFNPAADGWDMSQTYPYVTDVVISNNFISGMEVLAQEERQDGTPGYNNGTYIDEDITGETFRDIVPSNAYIPGSTQTTNRSYWSSRPYSYPASDGWYYWGENAQSYEYNHQPRDYRTNNSTDGRHAWLYEKYHRTKFNQTYYTVKKYYRTTISDLWIDYDRDQTWHSTPKRVFDNVFIAKAYSETASRIYGLEDTRRGTAGNYTYQANMYLSQSYDRTDYSYNPAQQHDATTLNLTNNNMYVLQITATSDSYVVGRPTLDANYQSQDHVVSPAFMIASQLGAVQPFNNVNTSAWGDNRTELDGAYGAQAAAKHCGTYMEVGEDGYRYTGWRLPTKEEVNIIIGYQNMMNPNSSTYNQYIATTFAIVLGGAYYWTLDGTSANVPTGSQGTANNAYVRCVRDISVQEMNDHLNKD